MRTAAEILESHTVQGGCVRALFPLKLDGTGATSKVMNVSTNDVLYKALCNRLDNSITDMVGVSPQPVGIRTMTALGRTRTRMAFAPIHKPYGSAQRPFEFASTHSHKHIDRSI